MESKVIISKKLVLINTLSSVAANVISMGIMLWLYPYLLGRISEKEYSLYPVVMSAVVFLSLLSIVLVGGLSRYIVEAYAKGDEERVTQIVSTMSALLFGAGLLVLAIGLVFSWYVDSVLTIVPERLWDARIMMALLVTGFVVQLVSMPFQAGIYVRQKFVSLNLIRLGQQLLRMVILFILLFCISTRVLWVVVASVSSNLCGIFLICSISRRLVRSLRFRRIAIHWPIAREMTSFGGWVLVARLSDLIRMNADPIILNKLATPLDVTCFHLGSMPFRQIQQFSSGAQGTLMPALTAMHAIESQDRFRSAYFRGGRYGLWAVLLLSVPMMIYSYEFITLWVGEKFLSGAMVIIFLLATYPVLYANVMMSNIAIAKARIRPLALRAILIQGINLALTIYLVGIRGMGAVGSALSTFLVMMFVWPIVNCNFALRLADASFTRWFWETIFPGWLPGLAGAMVWILMRTVVVPSTWLELAGCVMAGLFCYIAVLLLFCLQEQDRKDLQKVTAKVFARFQRFP